MVNEHLDEESHWLRHLLLFRWQHNREREGKERDGHRGSRRAERETYQTRGNKKRKEKEVKRPVKDGEKKGVCLVNFEILHTVLFLSCIALVDLHASDWLEELEGLVRVMALDILGSYNS